MRKVVFVVLLSCLGCGGAPDKLVDCSPADGVTPICGFENPEDLVAISGGEWLIVSQMAPPDAPPGSLVGFRVADGELIDLYPLARKGERGGAGGAAALSSSSGWGSSDCSGPPDPASFAPHGIDVQALSGEGTRLAVVNHGEREVIELFEIAMQAGRPVLDWRGCVLAPADAFLNDVVALADGRLFVTKMTPPLEGLSVLPTVLRLLLGRETGSVFEWRPNSGWREIEAGRGSAPNGIAVDSESGEIYFSEWSARRLTRLRPIAGGGWQRDSVRLSRYPDNISWSDSRTLLVAAQAGGVGDAIACGSLEGGTCALPFSVIEVDPRSLELRVLLDHPASATGAASSVVAVGDELYIGTFRGDRLGRYSLAP
jgi:hypothetical protein